MLKVGFVFDPSFSIRAALLNLKNLEPKYDGIYKRIEIKVTGNIELS